MDDVRCRIGFRAQRKAGRGEPSGRRLLTRTRREGPRRCAGNGGSLSAYPAMLVHLCVSIALITAHPCTPARLHATLHDCPDHVSFGAMRSTMLYLMRDSESERPCTARARYKCRILY